MSSKFKTELSALLNKYSMEGSSDTPDFILAEYICNCLSAFNLTIKRRRKWYTAGDEWKEIEG